MEPKEVPPLPGSDYFEPGDLEFYLKGEIEGHRPYDYRSPVMDDLHRMAAYRHCELLYFVGVLPARVQNLICRYQGSVEQDGAGEG